MSMVEILNSLDESAKDIKINFESLLADGGVVSQSEAMAVIYAVGISLVPSAPMCEIIQDLESKLDAKVINAAKIASALMSMNNIYYRFSHLSENQDLIKMPAGLRMQTMRQHGIDIVLFELMTLAISALNGCGMCINAHIRTLQKHDVGLDKVQFAGKVAGVLNALNQVTL